MKYRKGPPPLRADVINIAESPRRRRSGRTFFSAVRNAGRILCAFCGGLVIGCYLMGQDVTIPALAGAALGLNEWIYHLAESLASGRTRAVPARAIVVDG